jgi:hypothetical protein
MGAFIKHGKLMMAAAALLPTVVFAQIYRCDRDGAPLYTDHPCAPGAAPAQLPMLNSGGAADAGQNGLAQRFDAEAAQATAARDKADAAWLKHYRRGQARQASIRRGLMEGRVVKGMTRDQVRSLLNAPDRVQGEDQPRERWTYAEPGRRRRTVTFKDGLVVADSEGGRRR